MLIRFRQISAPVVLVAFTTFLATTILPPRVARAQSEPVPSEAPSDGTGTFEALKENARDPDTLKKDNALIPWRDELEPASDTPLADKMEANATIDQADGARQEAADKTVAPESPADVQAQALPTADRTGVTGKTISIPKGEGTIQGMEESFSAQLSTGIATFSVPFALPSARGGAQPSLGLSYSSSSGHGLAGVGWDLGVPFIARQTDRGVPKYDDQAQWHAEQDRFVFNGGQELVPICIVGPNGECPGSINRDLSDELMPSWAAGHQYFRARVEGSFLRFFWSPDHRTWRVQDKSGVTMELGVPLDGSNDENALERNPDAPANRPEIYRWLLVRQYDAYGNSQAALPAPVNVVRYRYFQDGGQAYLADIYDTPPNTNPATAPVSSYAHHTRIIYEDRTDPTFSFRSGWPMEQNLRVARVDVTSKPFTGSETSARELVRRYHLDYDLAFHASYLAAVEVEGRCADTGAPAQILEDGQETMGEGPNQLVMEALPELTGCPTLPPMRFRYTHVEGSSGGAIASASLPGYEAIDEEVVALSDSPDYSLDEQQTTLYDINADGLSDVLVTAAGFFGGKHGVFFNKASRFTADRIGVRGVLGADVGTIALSNLNVVPLDLDGDATSDLLHMPLVRTYSIYSPKKETSGWWWVGRTIDNADDLNPKIDFGRDTTDIKVVDVNFDGLVDVIRSTGTEFQTFLSLGRYPGGDGQFGDATRTTNTTARISTDPIRSCVPWRGTPVRLSDPDTFLGEMNGDGIADIVRVRRGDIRYWPGRGTGVWGVGSRSVGDCPEGTFAQGRDLAMDKSPYYSDIQGDSIRLDDVNGDGLDDLVQVNYDSVYIWLNVDGLGWTGQHQIQRTPYSHRTPGASSSPTSTAAAPPTSSGATLLGTSTWTSRAAHAPASSHASRTVSASRPTSNTRRAPPRCSPPRAAAPPGRASCRPSSTWSNA